MKIREILKNAIPVRKQQIVDPSGEPQDYDVNKNKRDTALQSIYKAGLEAMPAKKEWDTIQDNRDKDGWHYKRGHNQAVDEMQKKWAQLCGIEGESDG